MEADGILNRNVHNLFNMVEICTLDEMLGKKMMWKAFEIQHILTIDNLFDTQKLINRKQPIVSVKLLGKYKQLTMRGVEIK